METRWARAMGHCSNFGVLSEMGTTAFGAEEGCDLSDVLLKLKRKRLDS